MKAIELHLLRRIEFLEAKVEDKNSAIDKRRLKNFKRLLECVRKWKNKTSPKDEE